MFLLTTYFTNNYLKMIKNKNKNKNHDFQLCGAHVRHMEYRKCNFQDRVGEISK